MRGYICWRHRNRFNCDLVKLLLNLIRHVEVSSSFIHPFPDDAIEHWLLNSSWTAFTFTCQTYAYSDRLVSVVFIGTSFLTHSFNSRICYNISPNWRLIHDYNKRWLIPRRFKPPCLYQKSPCLY